MIPENFIIEWQSKAPWQSLAMVEQDLVISRALVELYQHPLISQSLVFRGGTALNKLYIQPASRYSEDIDLVQLTAAPIGEVITAIRAALDSWLGEPKRKLTQRSVKLIYRYLAVDNTPAKLKIEINTTEHFHVDALIKMEHNVVSPWWEGTVPLLTYSLNELMATKLRALYQRRKGRDLFDLWMVLTKELVEPAQVVHIFNQYCSYNNQFITRSLFEESLVLKCQHSDFLKDTSLLLTPQEKWDVQAAIGLVQQKVISLIA